MPSSRRNRFAAKILILGFFCIAGLASAIPLFNGDQPKERSSPRKPRLSAQAREKLLAKGLRLDASVIRLLPGLDDRSLISLSGGELRFWDLETQKYQRLQSDTPGVKSTEFCDAYVLERGQSLATANKKREIILWDLRGPSPQIRGRLSTPESRSRFTTNPTFLAALGPKKALVLPGIVGPLYSMDFESGETRTIGPGLDTTAAALSPDGSSLVTFEFLYELNNPARFPATGRPLADGCETYVLTVSDVRSGAVKQLMPTQQVIDDTTLLKHQVNAFAFHAEGTQLTTSGTDGMLRRWDLNNGQEILPGKKISGPSDRSNCRVLIAAPELQAIIAGTSDGRILVLEEDSLEERQGFNAHQGSVEALLLLQDGRSLVSGGSDGRVRFWNLKEQEQNAARKRPR